MVNIKLGHTALEMTKVSEPKEPTQFGSESGSEIQNLPISLSGVVSL